MEQDGYAYFQDANPSARYPDTINNLELLEVAQSPFSGTTKIRFRRAFFTGDYKQDVHILPVLARDSGGFFTNFDSIFAL